MPGFFIFSGTKLREHREAADMSREVLAIAVGMSASGIGLYETDHRSPSRVTLVRLAAILGVSPADLVEPDPMFEAVAP